MRGTIQSPTRIRLASEQIRLRLGGTRYPVAFSDPFGLTADSLRFLDPTAEAVFEDCRNQDVCSGLYESANGLSADITVRMAKPGEILPGGKQDGYTRLNWQNVSLNLIGGLSASFKYITGGEMIIQPESYGASWATEGVPIVNLSVTSHELGHVIGTSKLPAGVECAEKCAINYFENPVRQAAGLRLRTYNAALHGP